MSNSKKLVPIDFIEETRRRLGLTKTDLADAAGITVSTLTGHWYKKGELPKKYADKIEELFAYAEEDSSPTPLTTPPITIEEVARGDIPNRSQADPEPDEDPEFELPSVDFLANAIERGHVIDIAYADKIRAKLHIPQIYMDDCIGWPRGRWSRTHRSEKSLTATERVKIMETFASLKLLSEGVRLVPDSNGTDVQTIQETVKLMRENMETITTNRVQKRVASTFLDIIEEDLNKL